MVDSSLDWGQDLKGLGKWLKNKGLLNQKGKEIYISYFGIADIDYYVPGVKILPSYYYFGHSGNLPFELKGGIYCISVTMLKLVYLPTFLEVDNLKAREIDEALYGEVSLKIPELFNSLENPAKYKELISAEGIEYWKNYYRLYNSMRFAKLAKYLEKRVPDDNIGYSILIYKLDDAEVEAALKSKP